MEHCESTFFCKKHCTFDVDSSDRPRSRRRGADRRVERSGRRHPGHRAARGVDRLDELLNPKTGAEVERLVPFARDRFEIARDLDGLQVVEAELMTGRDAEPTVRWMIRARLDAAEAATSGGVGGTVEVQLVEALLAEGERAAAAVDLEVVLHLAAGGDPAGLHRSGRTAREAEE